MTRLKCLIANTFIFVSFVLCEDVEYYPSQAALNRYSNIAKRSVNEPELEKGKVANNIKWRYFNENKNETQEVKTKRAVDPIFHGHPKTREELWNERFLNKSSAFDQTPSLIKLIHNITLRYLNDCIPVILYDSQIKSRESYLFQNLLKDFPVSYVHGYIDDNNKLKEPELLIPVKQCLHFIVFLTEVKSSAKVLGKQSESKVVVVARSSQWAVQEFLASSYSRVFINLLVIGQSFKDDDDNSLEAPYILYTHKLYTDGLGASQPKVLSSWTHGKYSRDVNLFPPKMTEGYAGHRFIVAASNQPPFVFRKIKTDLDGGNPRVIWDGIEMRLLHLLAERNNFSIEILEPQEPHLGSGDAVSKEIAMGRADIGVAGMYLTVDRTKSMDMSFSHSQDCAVFITLMSTALPRYRAILGPFHWHVWVALTFTYLIGILPLAFSDKHTLRHLLHNSGEIENMFWYVFGTFTNCFTFVGKNSWSKTTKITTRLLIGWYWIFTIIITSCYTGSIIAFVTLPVFPETVDTIEQLIAGFYRVGTLDRGGWERWFFNSSDAKTNKLFKKLELVPNVESGIRNTTKAFFWPYAFLGSQAELEYIVQSNFTATKSKRAMLHISNECFVPFGVSMGFPTNSLYSAKLSGDLRRMFQSGIVDKIVDEVRWEMQRSATGKLLSAGLGSLKITSAEEKGLTLEDTQGMFLLLAAGFLMGASALVSEWMGGITRRCRIGRKKPSSANSKEELITTPDLESEIKVISDCTESRLNFDTRCSSACSRDTLEGQVINVTEENIVVHETLDAAWDSRRSSSVDLDREVQEIFEKDLRRRRIVTGDIEEAAEVKREPTASNGAFGDHLN
ncbi:ionotropic receptor 21a-like [Ostrinia furnacalis]|uniref:ionotropic receptor 21a-like n=1 Tax=Ostrinia furnacalis TaxID=93504 RepID=UPI00103FE0AE|nr:ionotropic receptor 21a-like [Ostrinia furnacalis]